MCKPFDHSPFICRQGLSSFVVWRAVGCENLFSYCRMPPNLCKVSASERNENLFSYCRMPPNLCKSTQIMIETAILRALFISCYHFYAYLCTKVLISEYKKKICL